MYVYAHIQSVCVSMHIYVSVCVYGSLTILADVSLPVNLFLTRESICVVIHR